jgi:hypothetical protein
LQLRLNAQQLEEKRAAEAAVTEIEELLAAESTEEGQQPLKEELSARQAALDKLMEDFEVHRQITNQQLMAVQQAEQCQDHH